MQRTLRLRSGFRSGIDYAILEGSWAAAGDEALEGVSEGLGMVQKVGLARMTDEGPPGGEFRFPAAEGWGPAILKAILLLSLALVGFLIVPDQLLEWLATRVSPRVRDALITVWTVAFFVALAWLFVRVQAWRRD